MKILDLLRKLGILRYGAEGGVYTDAAERPTSLQMDGVFDSKKDLVTREDVTAAREQLRQGGNPPR